MLRHGDVVNILYGFRNPGDSLFIWVAMTDEVNGELDISPIKTDSSLDEIKTVQAHMVEYKNINLLNEQIKPERPQFDFIAL